MSDTDDAESDVDMNTTTRDTDTDTFEIHELRNHRGAIARFIPLGATLVELHVPDRNGRLGDVVLGFEDLEKYAQPGPYFGCICGRVANRISRGRFVLDGVEYELDRNDGRNHLHGGIVGFDKVVWNVEPIDDLQHQALRFSYVSVDGEAGYPGELAAEVEYSLTESNELRIDYRANSDRATPLNLTNHAYFNLGSTGNVLDHVLRLNASEYTEPDAELIPTGRILPVAGTPLDFTEPRAIGDRIDELNVGGYDHNYVIASEGRGNLGFAAELTDPSSGRRLEVITTQPGVQLYSGNNLATESGKNGVVYTRHAGLCLEAQHFPDSVNHPHFPSTIVRPGQIYRHTTVYRFGVTD